MPVAVTLKLAVPPTATVWLAGCDVMVGAVVVVVTVSVAVALVTAPAEFETVTVYLPAFELCALAIEKVELVAPEIAVPLNFH